MESFNFNVIGHVLIKDNTNNKILLNKNNAIHPQNMSRIFARALAHSPNSWIYRMAFGNGGRYVNRVGSIVLRPPNTGTKNGWASRLYNETFSEIVDAQSGLLGTDPGSADANNIRIGGGANPSDSSGVDSVTSQEVGTISNVVINVFIGQNEPSGELSSNTTRPTTGAEQDFVFNELGLYSPGLQPLATHGYSTINVFSRTSQSSSSLVPNSTLTLSATVDGVPYTTTILVPASGTGTSGQITYGDLCQGLNTGAWIVGGDRINSYLYTYITDYSNGVYPSIINQQSYGMLTFQSLTTGSTSSVVLSCNNSNTSDLCNILTNGVCQNVNFTSAIGLNAGSQNDPTNPAGAAERLLAHITFDPITKAANVEMEIIYTLTITCQQTANSTPNILVNAS